jgi:zinc protease
MTHLGVRTFGRLAPVSTFLGKAPLSTVLGATGLFTGEGMRRVGDYRGLVLAVFLLAAPALATPPDGVVIRGDFGFKMVNLVLPSGMRIVVEEDRSQPLVAVVAIVDVGSAQDPIGKEGLAHLVEHLTFRAKPDGKLQRSNLLSFAGAGLWNADTSHDLTRYIAVGPTEALPQMLTIEGGRLLSPLAGVDARAFDVERGVVKNEILERDEHGRSTAVYTHLYGALYPPGHPYHRPVAGTEGSVASLTLADAEAFVKQYYVPRNVTLYVSGDVDLATIQKLFDATLPVSFLDAPAGGPVAGASRLSQEPPAVPAPPEKTQLETIRGPAERPTLYIGWSLPGGASHQLYLERFARTVFERVSAQAATLGSDIEELSASLDEGRTANTLICAVYLKTGKDPERSLERVLDKIVQMWVPSETGTDSVLNSAVDFHWMQNSSVIDVALATESIVSRTMSKATRIHETGDPAAWGKDLKAVYELRAAQMHSFAYEWLSRSRARAVFVQPSEGPSPRDTTGPPAAFASSDDVRAKIAPEALRTYVHGPVRDIRVFSLKNGLEVSLVRRGAAPTVAVSLGFRGGDATSEPLGAAELTSALARPQQTRNGPPSRFGARVYLSTTADATYYTARGASGNLENMLALLSDSAQSLHVDGSVKRLWDELVSGQRREDALPTAQVSRAFYEHTFPNSPLGRTAQANDYDKLGPGDLQTWIDRTFRPEGAVLAVVGDIDVVEAEKLVRDWFEGWHGAVDSRAEAQPRRAGETTAPVQVVRVDRAGAQQTEIRLGCSLPDPSQNEALASRLLGAHLRGRLGNLARSNLGGSYGFHGGAYTHRQAANLDVSGFVDSSALTRVLAVARKELDDLGTVKLTQDDLDVLKWHQGIASNIRYTTNSDLAQALVAMRLAQLPVDSIEKYPELLSAVTPEDLARVGAVCRKTAVLLVSGDPQVVTRGLQATAR